MRKRKNYEFTIEDMEFPGCGLTYVNGRKVLVKNALKGQKVIGKVSKKNSERVLCKLVEVLEDVDYKIEPVCKPFAMGCGGCSHQDVPYKMQLDSKEYQIFKLFREAEIDGFEYEGMEGSPEVFEYRNKMEFTFGDMEKGGELTLGLHVKNQSHGICTVDDCKLVDEDFRTVLSRTVEYFKTTGLKKYRVMQHEGYLRTLVVRKGINTGEILVNIVTTTQEDFDMKEFVDFVLSGEYKGEITGIIHTFNDSLSDIVQADRYDVLHGREYIYEELLGFRFKVNPFSFFQTNTKGAEKLYSIVREYISDTEDKVVFDLYCGTGTIGQIVAPKAAKVVGIELIEEAVLDARENAKLNGLKNTEFIAGDIAKVIHTVKDKPDIIILDPPRAGVHPFALKYVLKFNAPEIIYVSCNPKTLVEDLKKLEEGGYVVEKVRFKDMFPHTPHCETVVKLSKR